jgi:hypothetical protein
LVFFWEREYSPKDYKSILMTLPYNRLRVAKFILLSFVFSLTFAFINGVFIQNAFAATGEGTATVGGGASQTVEISSSTVFTTVLTVGVTGIAIDADSPTFAIPAGFTAPHAAGGASVPTNAGEVDLDGEWFALGAGGTCAITMGSSSATGQVITLDVTGACATTDTITLTYKGTASSTASAAASIVIETDDAAAGGAKAAIASPPTIVVNGTSVFADHATGTVATTNNLAGLAKIGGTDIVLGGFKVTAAGENVDLTTIRTTVTLGTMVIGELTNLRIVEDDGTGGGTANDGVIHADELTAPLATIASPSAGNNDFTVTDTVAVGVENYFIVGTIASTVSDADTIDVEATGAGSVASGATSSVSITSTGTSANSTRTITDTTAPTFTAARTALNTIVLTFDENVDATAADELTAWTVVGGTVTAVTDPANSTSLTITTTGLTATDGTPEVNYVAANGTVVDISAASNEVADGGAIAAADQVAPTFTAIRTALNTIALTFSENVTGTAIADSFTVVGASSVTNTAVTTNTSVTLTTVGLTATDGTPNVGYVSATGDILDNSAATNEVANGGAIAAADQVAPTFTVVGTSVNAGGDTIALTFSEAMTTSTITQALVRADTNITLDYSDDAGNTNAANITVTTTTVAWTVGDTVATITLDEAADTAYIPATKFIGVTLASVTDASAATNAAAGTEIYTSAGVAAESTAPTVTALGTGTEYYLIAAGATQDLVFQEVLDSASKTAVETAINGATVYAPASYSWSSTNGTVTITANATNGTLFIRSAIANVDDLVGNTASFFVIGKFRNKGGNGRCFLS